MKFAPGFFPFLLLDAGDMRKEVKQAEILSIETKC
jgi:hypothetical protein